MQNSLPADRIEFAKGRNEKEIVIRLFVGAIELSFIMPVEELFTKFGALAQQIKQATDTLQ